MRGCFWREKQPSMARLYNCSRSGVAQPVMQAAGHGPALPESPLSRGQFAYAFNA